MATKSKGPSAPVNYSGQSRKGSVKLGQRRVDAVSPGGADALGQHGRNQDSLVQGKREAPTDLGNAWSSRQVGDRARPGGSCDQILKNGGNTQHGSPSRGVADWAPDVSPMKPGKSLG
jgi:hypothetical protein